MTLSTRFTDAVAFAAKLHATHLRKGTTIPYLAHLMAVTAIVLEHGGTEDQAIAAMLHDTIEDHGPAYPGGSDALRLEIEGLFGTAVLAIVNACTDADTDPKPPWRARKEAYIAHLRTAPRDVLIVSCADKLHNSRAILRDYRTIGDALWSRFTADKANTLWYYRELLAAFQENHETPASLVSEFTQVVRELDRSVK
ncbi:MAG: HD domain-containing protein [Chloroflexi bacterium]|nr:HD domain-containing protein [Chloroflexota bacterium]